MAGPSRRRCAATSMNGMNGGIIVRKFIDAFARARLSANDSAWAFPFDGHDSGRRRAKAAGSDFKACDGLFAGHCRRRPRAYGAQEGEQLRAQRLGMSYRQVAHRIAAIWLETEAFGDLARQQIAGHVLAASSDSDVSRLEWRQPICVDVRKDARGG